MPNSGAQDALKQLARPGYPFEAVCVQNSQVERQIPLDVPESERMVVKEYQVRTDTAPPSPAVCLRTKTLWIVLFLVLSTSGVTLVAELARPSWRVNTPPWQGRIFLFDMVDDSWFAHEPRAKLSPQRRA